MGQLRTSYRPRLRKVHDVSPYGEDTPKAMNAAKRTALRFVGTAMIPGSHVEIEGGCSEATTTP